MPLTDVATVNATNIIPEIWGMKTIDTREAHLVMPNLMDRDYESELNSRYGGAGDSVRVFGVDNFGAARTKTVATDATLTIDEGVFNAALNILVDQHAYMMFEIDYVFEFQTHIRVFEKLASKAGYAVALAIDDTCAGLIDNFSQTVGALGTPLSDENVRDAVRQLNEAFAPEEARYLLCSPNQQLEFYNIEKYVNSLYKEALGESLNTRKFKGYFGSLYNMDWYMSQNVEGSTALGFDNGMWQREALALIIQDDMRSAVEYNILQDSTRFVVHALYGTLEMRDNHGVFMRGA